MQLNLGALAIAILVAGLSGTRASAAEVAVTTTSGQVTMTQAGHAKAAVAGTHLTLPLEIQTGPDGTADLSQLGSILHVGPNSMLVLPDAPAHDAMLEQIIQKAGSVLYNIKSRKEHPLSVETRYLVSVVKGTMFTIAVENDATTVALMEGSLDISAPGVKDHVMLKPNESIRHVSGESTLTVRPIPSAPTASMNGTSSHDAALPDSTDSAAAGQIAKDFSEAGAAISSGQILAAMRQPPAAPPAGLGTGGSGQVSSIPSNGATGGTSSRSTTVTATPPASTSTTTAPPTGTAATPPASTSTTTTPPTGTAATPPASTSTTTTPPTGTAATPPASTSTTTTPPTGTAATPPASTSTTTTPPTGTAATPPASTSTTTTSAGTPTTAPTGGSTTTPPPPTTILPAAGNNSDGSTGCNGKDNGTGQGKCKGHSKP